MEEYGLDVPQNNSDGKLSNKSIVIMVTAVMLIIFVFAIWVALIPSNGTGSDVGKVEVVTSQMSYDYNEYLGYDIEVNGTIKNNTTKDYSYVSVSFSVYDAAGNNLGTVIDSINNLSAGETWNFKAEFLYTETMPVSYKLKEINKW